MRQHYTYLALRVFLLFCFNAASYAGVCEYADTTYAKVATGIGGAGIFAGVGLKAAGVTALAHSSGAAIAATASGGYLAGTLGAVGTVTGVMTAPATLMIGGVVFAAAGGTVGYCHYKNGNKQALHASTGVAIRKHK